jgi:hypothetical protein
MLSFKINKYVIVSYRNYDETHASNYLLFVTEIRLTHIIIIILLFATEIRLTHIIIIVVLFVTEIRLIHIIVIVLLFVTEIRLIHIIVIVLLLATKIRLTHIIVIALLFAKESSQDAVLMQWCFFSILTSSINTRYICCLMRYQCTQGISTTRNNTIGNDTIKCVNPDYYSQIFE